MASYTGRVDHDKLTTSFPSALFYLDIDATNDFVVYCTERKGDNLGIKSFWVPHGNYNGNLRPIPDNDPLYGFSLRNTKDPKVFRMMIFTMGDNFVNLHLRDDGRVVPKMVLKNRNFRPQRAIVDCSKQVLVIHGVQKKKGVGDKPVEEVLQPDKETKQKILAYVTGMA